MEFERFAINVTGEILFVIPQGDNSYLVYREENRLGIIDRETSQAETRWISPDFENADYLKQIGDAIDDHEM